MGEFAIQQALAQQAVSTSMVKQQAKSEQAIANMITQATQSAPGAGRGGNLDITV